MSEEAQGLEKYTPTRLQWLVVELNSLFQRMDFPGFNSFFIASEDGKSIIFAVRYDARLEKEVVDKLIDRSKDLILEVAKGHGWDSWVEVKTDITVIGQEENGKEQNESLDK